MRLHMPVHVLPKLFSVKKKERAAAIKTLREDHEYLRQYLLRGAATFRNDPAYSKYVYSSVDELVAQCLSDNARRDDQCLVLQRRFTKVPKSDKALSRFVSQEADTRARLDRLCDRIQGHMRMDRIMAHEIAYASGTNLKTHQGYLTAMAERVSAGKITFEEKHGSLLSFFSYIILLFLCLHQPHSLQVCDRICQDILARYARPHVNQLLQEIDVQRQKLRATIAETGFTRPALLGLLTTYMQQAWSGSQHPASNMVGNRPLVIVGESGMGKSWLIAHAVRWAQQQCPELITVARIVGCTSASVNVEHLLRSICEQIVRAYGDSQVQVRRYSLILGWPHPSLVSLLCFGVLPHPQPLSHNHSMLVSSTPPLLHITLQLPSDFEGLRLIFHSCMRLASAARPLLIVIDGLDRLRPGSAGLQNLQWLHLDQDLPAHVSLVVSTLPVVADRDCTHDLLAAAQALLPFANNYVEVGPLSREVLNASAVCVLLNDLYHRTLTPEQSRVVVWTFDQHPSPLMLRLLLAVAALWTSSTAFSQGPAALQAAASESGLPGVVHHLIGLWEEVYGPSLIRRLLLGLALSADGLTVSELQELLLRDPAARRDLAIADDPASTSSSSVCALVWPLLYRDLRVLLDCRCCDNGSSGVGSQAGQPNDPGTAFVMAHRCLTESIFLYYGLDDDAVWREAHRVLAIYHETSGETLSLTTHGSAICLLQTADHNISSSGSIGSSTNSSGSSGSGSAGSSAAGGNGHGHHRGSSSGNFQVSSGAMLTAAGMAANGLEDDSSRALMLTSSQQFLNRCGLAAGALLQPNAWLSMRLRRTLQLLALHQLQAGRLGQAEDTLTDLSYAVLKVQAGQAPDLLADLQLATAEGGVVPAHIAVMTALIAETSVSNDPQARFNLLQQALCDARDADLLEQARALSEMLPRAGRRAMWIPALPEPRRRRAIYLGGHQSTVSKVLLAGHSGLLLAMRSDRTIAIVNLETGKCTGTLTGSKGVLLDMDVSGDGSLVVATSRDGTVLAWQLPQGKLQSKINLPSAVGEAAQVSVCNDGSLAALRFTNGSLAVWDLAAGDRDSDSRRGSLNKTNEAASAAAHKSPLQARGSSRALDLKTGLYQLDKHTDIVTDCSFAPVGYTLASASRDESVVLWNARSRTVMRVLQGHQGSVETCRFHPSGAFVITGSGELGMG